MKRNKHLWSAICNQGDFLDSILGKLFISRIILVRGFLSFIILNQFQTIIINHLKMFYYKSQ